MPVYYEWSYSKSERRAKLECPRFEVTNHPLKSNTVSMKKYSSKSLIEQLNKWSIAYEEIDPLLRFKQMEAEEDAGPVDASEDFINYTKAWDTRRVAILNKYTTGEKLTIVSSFLPGGEKALIRQVSNLNEKVKHRLEQLDYFDENLIRKTIGLSQQEFVAKINMLGDEIKKAWDTEQRVKAFKIAIQCSKLLSDVNVMQFYPSKFVLITDILDTFGNLVFERLKDKSFGKNDSRSVHDIESKEVSESAKETCQNWLFKMASIRELLPRLYMEMSLLKCYAFLSKDDIKPVIARLTKMIRGIGNPLVAVYLRVYLCRVALQLLRKESEEFFYENIKEFFGDYQQIFHPVMKKKYEVQLLTLDQYLNLYVPAADWILYGTINSDKCKYTLLEEFLRECEQMENNELFLYCLVSGFDSTSVIKKSSEIIEMIQNSAHKMVLVNDVLSALGEHLCAAQGFNHAAAEVLTQAWWKLAANISSGTQFLRVLGPWLQFACTYLSMQHVNIILRSTIRYMVKCGNPIDDYSSHFQLVLNRMLKAIPDVEEIFLMDAFMPLLELMQSSNARTMMAKTVLSMFFTRYNSNQIYDHIIIGSLMRLCCILHDSISAVTVEDEIKLCADLIIKFVLAVSYQDDIDQQLNFYVECRAAFIKLDAVLIALVHRVNALAARAAPRGGRWTLRACAAYCCVTTPSLRCVLTKLQLHLLSGQVALLNNCLGQAEANFKAFISLIPDIPEYVTEDGQKKPTNVKVSALLGDFLSTLLVLPDNLDDNCKAIRMLNGFTKTINAVQWRHTEPLYYTLLLRALDLSCALSRDTYQYHIPGVISNDELYGGEEEFRNQLKEYSTFICQRLLVALETLGDSKETKKQHSLSLELLWRVMRRADLQDESMVRLATYLWLMAQRLDPGSRLASSMLTSLERYSSPGSDALLQNLRAA